MTDDDGGLRPRDVVKLERELIERLAELEDALLGYFRGEYPRGTCRSREDAVRTIWEATERARERELETLHEAAET